MCPSGYTSICKDILKYQMQSSKNVLPNMMPCVLWNLNWQVFGIETCCSSHQKTSSETCPYPKGKHNVAVTVASNNNNASSTIFSTHVKVIAHA